MPLRNPLQDFCNKIGTCFAVLALQQVRQLSGGAFAVPAAAIGSELLTQMHGPTVRRKAGYTARGAVVTLASH